MVRYNSLYMVYENKACGYYTCLYLPFNEVHKLYYEY